MGKGTSESAVFRSNKKSGEKTELTRGNVGRPIFLSRWALKSGCGPLLAQSPKPVAVRGIHQTKIWTTYCLSSNSGRLPRPTGAGNRRWPDRGLPSTADPSQETDTGNQNPIGRSTPDSMKALLVSRQMPNTPYRDELMRRKPHWLAGRKSTVLPDCCSRKNLSL
jgi:hypothetical protein